MTQRMDYARAAPGGMKAFGAVHGYVAQSGLPAGLVDLVYLRVSLINGCAYCIDMHSRDLVAARERAALAWTGFPEILCIGVQRLAFFGRTPFKTVDERRRIQRLSRLPVKRIGIDR